MFPQLRQGKDANRSDLVHGPIVAQNIRMDIALDLATTLDPTLLANAQASFLTIGNPSCCDHVQGK